MAVRGVIDNIPWFDVEILTDPCPYFTPGFTPGCCLPTLTLAGRIINQLSSLIWRPDGKRELHNSRVDTQCNVDMYDIRCKGHMDK